MTNGIITADEGRRLKELRDRLGLTDHQAAEIARPIAHERRAAQCPHCGQSLDPVLAVREHDAEPNERDDAVAGRRPARARAAATRQR